MFCVSLLSAYVCSNSAGTTCVKQAVTIPVTNVGTCAPTDGILLSNSEYSALQGNISAASTTASTAYSLASQSSNQIAQGLTLTVQPYFATPDDYLAVTTVFAAVLVAMCTIWGYHRVIDFFRSRPEY